MYKDLFDPEKEDAYTVSDPLPMSDLRKWLQIRADAGWECKKIFPSHGSSHIAIMRFEPKPSEVN